MTTEFKEASQFYMKCYKNGEDILRERTKYSTTTKKKKKKWLLSAN